MVNTIKNRRAFTLLEVVIYLALFTLVTTGVVRTVYTLTIASEEGKAEAAVLTDGQFVLDKIAWALSDVVAISTEGADTLVVTRSDTPGPIRFFVTADRWFIRRGGSEPEPLTSAAPAVRDVVISLTHPTPEANYLELSFKIGDKPFSLSWPAYE